MDIDHIHFYVEDAKASRDWFVRQLGFVAIAFGTTTHTRTEIVKSGGVYFVLESPLPPGGVGAMGESGSPHGLYYSPVRSFLLRHPVGVADIAFRVYDLEGVIAKATLAGAKILQLVQEKQLDRGSLKWAKIAGIGDLTHTLLQRNGVTPLLIQESELIHLQEEVCATQMFTGIDHVVLNVAMGDLERTVAWYENTLGFGSQQTFAIQTERSGLHSQVLVHPSGGAQLPINEPTSANSQIQEFLDVNRGPGVQHIALRTDNIVQAVDLLRQRGLAFLAVPPTYYSVLRQRCRFQMTAAQWEAIERSQILVDWQEDTPDALLLQIFTQPIFDHPTFFFELIERREAARGFGEGNFRALFEAMEREQLTRGKREG